MTAPTATHERPLWETARHLYDTARENDESSSSSESLAAELRVLIEQMLNELRKPTQGIITQAARDQFNLTVANRASIPTDADDFLLPGDLRLISPRFLPGENKPVAVLLLDQDFETDEWTIIPFSGADSPLHAGEWITDRDEALVRVLCFWNARRLQGCVLEESQRLDSVSDDELTHCIALNQALAAGKAWPEADAARSGDPWSADRYEREEHEDEQREIMRSLANVQSFRPSAPSGAAALLASAADQFSPHQQTYTLPGFGRSLSLRSSTSGMAEVILSERTSRHAARLTSPVLITGIGTEHPLQEGVGVEVPMRALSRGFWISVGEFGWASLVAVQS
jgi:hypothetical protein